MPDKTPVNDPDPDQDDRTTEYSESYDLMTTRERLNYVKRHDPENYLLIDSLTRQLDMEKAALGNIWDRREGY